MVANLNLTWSVDISSVDLSVTSFAGGIDYALPPLLTLVFTSGQTVGAQQCTVVSAFDDPLYEGDEIFSIALTTLPEDQGSVRFTEGENVTTVTILRDLNDSMFT